MDWFNDTPDIARKEVTPVEENWLCPQAGCGGVMVATGEMWPTWPPGYFHKCNACGYSAALHEKYPRIGYIQKVRP